MIEWIFGLGALAVLFFAVACSLAVRCGNMYDQIKKLESSNADLRYSVKHLKGENEKFRSGVYVTQDSERITALKLSLHLKQEKIDALQAKLRKQEQLLNQKWEGSKKCI